MTWASIQSQFFVMNWIKDVVERLSLQITCLRHFIDNYFIFVSDQPGLAYQTQFDSSPGRVISKYALGKFLIDCLSQQEFYGRTCGICNKH